MKPEYKKILHARQALDKARWELGDALVAECGAPDPTSPGYDGPGKLRAAWNYMRENGYNCTLEDLSELRRVAYVFRESTRRSDISWDLHAELARLRCYRRSWGRSQKGPHLPRVTLPPSANSGAALQRGGQRMRGIKG